MSATITIKLDLRKIKSNGKYPVKLRVFTLHPRKQKLYSTGIDLSKSDFNKVWHTKSSKDQYIATRAQLLQIENKAIEDSLSLTHFCFIEFEKKFLNHDQKTNNVVDVYNETINQLIYQGRIGTGISYRCSVCNRSPPSTLFQTCHPLSSIMILDRVF